MAIEIVDLPMSKCDFPSFFVCLPEAMENEFWDWWNFSGHLFQIAGN